MFDACVRSYILAGAGHVPLGDRTTDAGLEDGGGTTLSYMAFAAAPTSQSLVHGFVCCCFSTGFQNPNNCSNL